MPDRLPIRYPVTVKRSRAARAARDAGNSGMVIRERGMPCVFISLPMALRFPVLLTFTRQLG